MQYLFFTKINLQYLVLTFVFLAVEVGKKSENLSVSDTI